MKAYARSRRTLINAVCDLDAARLEEAARENRLRDDQLYTDYDAFLAHDLDIVVVGTPIPFHAEQVTKALKAGRHVLSEVTAANTVEGCAQIYETARTVKAKYMLAENYVYFHFIQEWKRSIDAGRIGRIHYAEGEYVHDIRDLLVDTSSGETFWRTYRPPIHYCTHCLGPLLFLMGDDYIVKATASGSRNTILPEHWPSTIDMQVALFETKEGRGIKVCRSQVTPRPEPHCVYYSVYGTRGFLENDRTGAEVIGHRYFEGFDAETVPMNCYQTRLDAPDYAKGGHGTSDYYLSEAFLDCIEFDTKPPIDVDRAMEWTLPGIIAHEAAVRGNVWLDVPHF